MYLVKIAFLHTLFSIVTSLICNIFSNIKLDQSLDCHILRTMSQECKQTEGLDVKTLAQLPDVFTMCKEVEIHQSQDLGTRLKCTNDVWVSAGLDYPIDPKVKTRFTCKM